MTDSSESTALMSNGEQGLFSLVEAATIARPIANARQSSVESTLSPGSYNGPSSLGAGGHSVGSSTKVHAAMKHRRLSSTGQTRRRMSDAREATSRPSPALLQSASATLSSLATLSLSGSPPPQSIPQTATSFTSASGMITSGSSTTVPKIETRDDDVVPGEASAAPPVKTEISGGGISVTKTGKKRGTIFKCESCSKVYRHPSCLIKHRWEHSPHWREASKFLLSKHQQVQLLEAAAILSHLAPSAAGGTSLPEDRSLWPSFLSGGLLPPPDQANLSHDAKPSSKARGSSVASVDQPIAYPTSSSVPAPSLLSSSVSNSSASRGSGTPTSIGRPPSAGPRMHNYAIPSSGGITQVRPGVVGVPTNTVSSSDIRATSLHRSSSSSSNPQVGSPAGHQRSAPVPVPVTSRDAYRERADGGAYSFVSGASVSDAWSSPVSVGFAQSSFRSSVTSVSFSASAADRSFSEGAGGWSLPHSSLRSSSLSRSRSGSVEMEDAERVRDGDDYVDVESVEHGGRFGFTSRAWKSHVGTGNGKIEEEEWDGMEMEMEM
ncbi:hypothetical protein L226DRAFT_530975 [Lentinus tigrinus ALCF2SS1-7]|uniref:C2H2-type domain-containing protein n=1 Tax=Lentinus tigrinus ALCF2SS1-6 TaxID=1328759 RepID=A0A5C2SQU7_9APHY|nr:hypothetical protein L227DRAFT_570768 [Lentinus tigrinus ALCF2SS1-6]RPD79150.1 hypothetical protein L226DRAFT_530975 [Lentinus tigrinus ALCF2SS1-7]